MDIQEKCSECSMRSGLSMCVCVCARVQLPQDSLQPTGSSYEYPFGMDVKRKTYGYFGHLILVDTWCLADEFSKRMSVYAQEVIFRFLCTGQPIFMLSASVRNQFLKWTQGKT